MSENVGDIFYTVDAKTEALVTKMENADAALTKTQREFGKTDKSAESTQHQMTKTAAAAKQLANEASAASNPLAGLSRVLAGIATVQGAMSLVRMAEEYGEMSERVQMATSSAEEYEHVQARILETSNNTYRAMREGQELYILTADALRSMKYSTDQALDVTDSLSYAFVKNATSVDRAASTTSAFTSAIMKGKVEADAWSTIIAAIPTVISDIAAASGKTTEEIRKMGAEGKLSSAMLTEGLRQSLDSNKTAAEGMATSVKDAFTQLNNNLAMYVGEANKATGVTSLMSKAIMLIGQNIDTVAQALLVFGAGALAKHVAAMTVAIYTSTAAGLAARKQAADELALATAHAAAASAATAQAAATAGMIGSHAAAARAADLEAAAQTRLAAAKAATSAAGAGLVGVLGGPFGIIALLASAAAGAYLFGQKSSDAAGDVAKLTAGVEKLTLAQLEQRRVQAQSSIDALTKQAREANAAVQATERQIARLQKTGASVKEIDIFKKSLVDQKAESDTAVQALQAVFDADKKLYDFQQAKTNKKPTSQVSPVSAVQSDPEVLKKLAAMREEEALAKVIGIERARLQAIQKLGTNATAEERAEAIRLAESIYKLEQGRKTATEAGKKATDESKKAAEQKKKEAKEVTEAQLKEEEKLRDLAKQFVLANLTGRELAETQAVMAMGVYATPDQIESAKTLAGWLFDINKQNELRAKIGADPSAYIAGTTEPISGGQFDTQQARYDAEAKKEQERYTAQLIRLQEAMEAQKLTQEMYQAEFEKSAQNHADRMAQIEQAKSNLMLSTTEAAFGSAADALKSAFGEQNALYRAAFVAQKAFAIAQSVVAIQQGIALAAANPFPANLAAMASVAAATAGIIGNISSVTMGGGRQYGGPVAPGKMHRINEDGRPEVFNAANGQQFMMANTRGEVVSNRDATAGANGGGNSVVVNLIEDRSRAGQVESTTSDNGNQELAIFVADIRGGGQRATTLEQTYGLQRQGR